VTFERVLRQGKRDRPDAPPVAVAPAAVGSDDVAGLGAAEAVQRLLRSPPGSARRARLVAHLAQLGPAAAAALREVFPGPLDGPEDDARPFEERGPVLAALVGLGPVGTSDLLALLAQGDPDQRRLAAGTLGRTGDPASFLPLADAALALDGAPGEAAVAALVALRKHPDFRPALARLRKALLGPVPAAAARASSALGRLGDAEAVPLLVQVLDTAEPVHGAASAALETLTGLRAAGPAGWLAWWKARL
jgi:HEAT repeat protein